MNYNLCLQHVLSKASEKQAPQPGCVRVVLQLLRRGEKVLQLFVGAPDKQGGGNLTVEAG